MTNHHPFLFTGALLLFILSLIFAASDLHLKDDVHQEMLYCDMVREFKSDPEKGWPDFKGVYDKSCKKMRPPEDRRKTRVKGGKTRGVVLASSGPSKSTVKYVQPGYAER